MPKGVQGFQKGHGDLGSAESHNTQAEKLRGRKYPNQNSSRFWKGKKMPLWVRRKFSIAHGGTGEVITNRRRSAEHIEWRRRVFERDDYRCLGCGERGVELNADHIYPFAYFLRLRFDINNGQTLCVPCHKKTPTHTGKVRTYMKGIRAHLPEIINLLLK